MIITYYVCTNLGILDLAHPYPKVIRPISHYHLLLLGKALSVYVHHMWMVPQVHDKFAWETDRSTATVIESAGRRTSSVTC